MKTTPLLALLLCAGLAPASWSRPSDDDFNSSLNDVRTRSKAQSAPAPAAEALRREPASERQPKCMTFGSRTENIPVWSNNPLELACKEDPLSDASAAKAAFDKVMAAVRSEDRRAPAGPFDDHFPAGAVHFESGVGRGNVKADTLDAKNHWGDVAVVHLKPRSGGSFSVVSGKLSTFRANQLPGRQDLEGDRVDCNFHADGSLTSVQTYNGLRMAGANMMSWIGPGRSPNTEQDLAGWWTIKCHQLLKSWADSSVGTTSTPQ